MFSYWIWVKHMNMLKVILVILLYCWPLCPQVIAAGDDNYWPLDQSRAVDVQSTSRPSVESFLTWGYNFTLLDNFVFEDDLLGISFSNEKRGVRMHTYSLNGVSADGPLFFSYGSSDRMQQEPFDSKRNEIDLAVFLPRKGSVGSRVGLRYSKTNLGLYGYELKYWDLGLIYGWGGNHFLSDKFRLMSIYWTTELYCGGGKRDFPEALMYLIEDEENYFIGGGSGTLGAQIHLGKYCSLAVGYKGVYRTSGDIKQSYHGFMATALLLW